MSSLRSANLFISFGASLLAHFALLAVSLPVGVPTRAQAKSLMLEATLTSTRPSSAPEINDHSISLTAARSENTASMESPPHRGSITPTPAHFEHKTDQRNDVESGIIFETPFRPFYPLHLLNRGTRGHVTVKLLISDDGAFREIEIIDSTPTGAFDDEVLRALQTARTKPKAGQTNQRYVLSIVFDPGALGSTHKFIEQK